PAAGGGPPRGAGAVEPPDRRGAGGDRAHRREPRRAHPGPPRLPVAGAGRRLGGRPRPRGPRVTASPALPASRGPAARPLVPAPAPWEVLLGTRGRSLATYQTAPCSCRSS